MRVGSQDFSVCDTRGGLGSSCLWPGSAAQPCTPAAPACQPQFPARPAYLSLISASLLPRRASYLQARPDASPSRFEVSVLRICCSRRCPGDGVLLPVPGQRAPHVGWLMGLGGISVIDGSKALLREWSLFLQKFGGGYPPWDDVPRSPSCCCTGAQGGLDGTIGLVNYSPLFARRKFVEGFRPSIYISGRKINWKH